MQSARSAQPSATISASPCATTAPKPAPDNPQPQSHPSRKRSGGGCGFRDANSLSHHFRKLFGISICETTRSIRLFFMCRVGIVYEFNALRRRTLPGIHNHLPLDISHERGKAAYIVRKRLVETYGRLDFV